MAEPAVIAAPGRAPAADAAHKPNQPTINLPKGGGAIKGIGEKFAANPVTGTGSMSVPIATSPGRSGFGPQLTLSYDSGSGNGPFGLGWSLSVPVITRKTDKGLPQYQDAAESDVYILSGAEDLVPVLKPGGTRWSQARSIDSVEYYIHRYRPRIEGLFARIERWTNVATGEIHWRSITRDNVTTIYGKDHNSRIFGLLGARRLRDSSFANHEGRWLVPLHPPSGKDLVARSPPSSRRDLVCRQRRGGGLAQERRSGRDGARLCRVEPDDPAPIGVPIPQHRWQPSVHPHRDNAAVAWPSGSREGRRPLGNHRNGRPSLGVSSGKE
ncbi:SpvB/TcaC N-terminal domain-containing protein [Sinorhizobium meliloti]|nr:SpvB/TcaC N-terminal domain-containing protein [Sinorhizobium meliloti]RVM04162.1 hypothetical protein CN134_32150 [Sinorhizobium meliloti]RVO21841.1 hypothetical protein CN098_32570 [Sinorhizobium meliloti]